MIKIRVVLHARQEGVPFHHPFELKKTKTVQPAPNVTFFLEKVLVEA